jgi:hypothetical protein
VPGKAKAAGAASADSGTTSLNSNNGGTTLSWSCRTNCTTAVTEGGRIGYWDYSTGAIAYIYIGQAVQADTFTTPTR